MSIKKVLESLNISLNKEEMAYLKKETKEVVSGIKEEVDKNKDLDVSVFVGGSFAKDTLAKKDWYDIDIFVRFGWKHEEISFILEKILKKALGKKFKLTKVHGSRDYFRASRDKKIVFEIIPVTKIKHPREARNVTDLSYFHVNYVKKRLTPGIANGIRFSKKFCKAQGVYGAESYIQGFSGYGLECLVIYYKSFEKMLKELVKVKDRLVLDPEKKYKKKDDVLFEMNESKLHSPVILVDPTWKERNALAALSKETFEKFREAAKKFLKKPSKEFFDEKELDKSALEKEAKKKKAELIHLALETDRQEGDIAGTKLKKFSNFLTREISKYFVVVDREFDYDGDKKGEFYIITKPKEEVVKRGPPVEMKKHAAAFRKENKNVFEKSGVLYSKTKVDYPVKKFIKDFIDSNKSRIKDMTIISLKII